MANDQIQKHEYSLPTPNPDLQFLNRLVGTWVISGGAEGTVTYKWMEGGFFLLQDVDLKQNDQEIKGIEIIGHLQPFGGQPSQDIKSRYYDSIGNTFDYVYEMQEDDLIIWAGEKNSPTYFKGTFDAENHTNTGAWIYPDGSGYKSTMTKLK